MGVHEGHRKRLRQRVATQDADQIDEYVILEWLLTCFIKRKDVNPIAHRLIERFGSLAAVLDASPEELMKEEGIGRETSVSLATVRKTYQAYEISKTSTINVLDTTDKIGRYLLPRFYGAQRETLYIICLDKKRKVLVCKKLREGGADYVEMDSSEILQTAISYNASSIIIAHNHTSGIAIPSEEDEVATAKIAAVLRMINVELLDHIIIADDDFVSMADSGFLKKFQGYNT